MKAEWLKVNADILRIAEIEKRIGCPERTLVMYVSGKRDLPEKWVKAVDDYVEGLIMGISRSGPNIRLVGDPEKYKILGMDKELHVQKTTSVISEDGKTVLSSGPGHEFKDFDSLRETFAKAAEMAFEQDKPKELIRPDIINDNAGMPARVKIGKKKKEPKVSPEVVENKLDELKVIVDRKKEPEKKIVWKNAEKKGELEHIEADPETGEIIEKKKVEWKFYPILSDKAEKIDYYTRKEGDLYEVMKVFGPRKKYCIVDSLLKVNMIKVASINQAQNMEL